MALYSEFFLFLVLEEKDHFTFSLSQLLLLCLWEVKTIAQEKVFTITVLKWETYEEAPGYGGHVTLHSSGKIFVNSIALVVVIVYENNVLKTYGTEHRNMYFWNLNNLGEITSF